ncbi:MAG TPA: sugar ABC transporter permease [Firmicutes bacterium]|nr:sugar ABC transporter permease [Bacillota bacterium]
MLQRLPKSWRKELQFFAFISPWLLGFIAFSGGPIIASAVISFTDWNILSTPKFVGLANYQRLVNDPLVWKALGNTIYYTIGSVILMTVASLLTAILLNQELRGVRFFRTLYFLPSVTSGVAIAILFAWMYNPEFGIINYMLYKIGIVGPNWLFDEFWAMPAIIFMSLWTIGSNMMIILAGLQDIPQSLVEAARLDGANWWQEFRYVTIPMLSPVLFLVIITSTINSFQVFLQPYVMTEGGPGNATLVLVLYLYQNAFLWWKMGYGAAIAWILAVIILILTLIQFRLAGYWVYYEGERRS